MGAGWCVCPPLDRALGLAALGSTWELTCVGESFHGDVLPQTFFTTSSIRLLVSPRDQFSVGYGIAASCVFV